MNSSNKMKALGLSLAMVGMFVTGCSTESDFVSFDPAQAQPLPSASPSTVPTPATRVQVEQLARPVVNEATIVTNAFANIYNSVGPDFMVKALQAGTAENTAAAPILAEAATTLSRFAAFGSSGGTSIATANSTAIQGYVGNVLVPSLLPDVMRIDTRVTCGVNETAFTKTVSNGPGPGFLAGGRKITDDVMDVITATATNTASSTTPIIDNVPYYRPATGPGSNNTAIGHDLLNGQTTPGGAATFPFLAKPN